MNSLKYVRLKIGEITYLYSEDNHKIPLLSFSIIDNNNYFLSVGILGNM